MKFIFFSLHPEFIRQGFTAIDMNHDGVVTSEDQLDWIRKYDLNGNHSTLKPKFV